MTGIRNVEAVELHDGTHRLFTVYTHGARNLALHVDEVEFESVDTGFFADPKSDHGEWYGELHFETPRTIEVLNDTLIL